MKSISKPVRLLIPLAILLGPGTADPLPQSDIRFTQVAAGRFAADWTGVAGKTYFFQRSTDMVNWDYAPFMAFGEGEHSYGYAGTGPKYFYRLHHGEFPGINSLEDAMNASFAGDGLSNIFKITYGYDPFHAASTIDGPDNLLDPDQDGMTNLTEHTLTCDPMRKDNPLVKLEVTVQ